MPANYGMLLMSRDVEQYSAIHLSGSAVLGFLTNANYCAVMALVHGAPVCLCCQVNNLCFRYARVAVYVRVNEYYTLMAGCDEQSECVGASECN